MRDKINFKAKRGHRGNMTFCKSLYLSVVVMDVVIAFDLLTTVDYYRTNQYVVVEIGNYQ